MKIRFLLAIVVLMIGFAPPTWAQQTDAPDPQLRQMIDEFAKKYAEAVNKNDAVAVAAFYTEDGVFVTSDGPKYGRTASRNFMQPCFGNSILATILQKLISIHLA